MTRRGRIKLAVFCLLAGAVINIAVAWGCALWSHANADAPRDVPDPVADQIETNVAPPNWCRDTLTERYQSFGKIIDNLWGSTEIEPPETQPAVIRSVVAVTLGQPPDAIGHLLAGWPLLAFEDYVVVSLTSRTQPQRRLAFQIPFSLPRFDLTRDRWLPYGPLWPGLIINTLFYAAIVWLVVRSPFETRRRLRQWRGLCEKCAYPTGASPVCTECGALIKQLPRS